MEKLNVLKSYLQQFDSAIVAYSGGVDSTLLARVAKDEIKKLLLVTATSPSIPFYELDEAATLAELMEVEHRIVSSNEMSNEKYISNSDNRCFYCKFELFSVINEIAEKEGYQAVFDGNNYDDIGDYRPGRKASREKGVFSPLIETKLTKDDVREISRYYKLPTAEKPSYACLASRIPYGEEITEYKLDRVAMAEFKIRQLGFAEFRVRSHENMARLEFSEKDMHEAWHKRKVISDICKEVGFIFVSLDMDGYKTGSMNKVIEKVS